MTTYSHWSSILFPTTSVIIRAYNEEKHIQKLLVGLQAQTCKPNEIILVDSGSTDRTREIAEEFDVKLVHMPKAEFTFGRSLNIGCAAANSDILIFLSAHTYPLQSDWLENMLAPFSDENVWCVYGKQRGNEATKFSEHQIFNSWFPDQATDDPNNYFCNNANCAIRKIAWVDTPYDEQLTGLEDIKWSKTVHAQGYKIAYSPAATIIHVHDETWKQIENRYFREALALREIEPATRISAWQCIQSFINSVTSDTSNAYRNGVLIRNLATIIRFRYAQYYGVSRAIFSSSVTSKRQWEQLYFPRRGHTPDKDQDLATQLPEKHIDYHKLILSKEKENKSKTKG